MAKIITKKFQAIWDENKLIQLMDDGEVLSEEIAPLDTNDLQGSIQKIAKDVADTNKRSLSLAERIHKGKARFEVIQRVIEE